MDNLQKEIVDERRGQYIKTLGPTTEVSLSPFGLKIGARDSVALIGDPFQPPPYGGTNRQSLWAKILGNEAGFVVGHASFSDPIQSIQPLRVEVDRSVTNAFRERETKWRRTNAEALKSFENEWVVLEGDEIIAHGDNPIRVIEEARSKGISTPYIFFVESQSKDYVNIGL
jgi:hypothetical protein